MVGLSVAAAMVVTGASENTKERAWEGEKEGKKTEDRAIKREKENKGKGRIEKLIWRRKWKEGRRKSVFMV